MHCLIRADRGPLASTPGISLRHDTHGRKSGLTQVSHVSWVESWRPLVPGHHDYTGHDLLIPTGLNNCIVWFVYFLPVCDIFDRSYHMILDRDMFRTYNMDSMVAGRTASAAASFCLSTLLWCTTCQPSSTCSTTEYITFLSTENLRNHCIFAHSEDILTENSFM